MAGLNVIALVSGGKDSFFSLLHCRANGHRVVALANLHPAEPASRPPSAATSATAPAPSLDQGPGPSNPGPGDQPNQEEPESDLNSFMYQTVGHQVLPLYADATGLPLFRRPILGGAGRHGKDYHAGDGAGEDDEAESMTALLRAVMAAHPEANAVSAGAILSTYQRTRVESVAVRLGLVPLAYLWKFPVLPSPGGGAAGDGQLLDDMAAVGLEARIIKVASGGLDDEFLWTNIASPAGKARVAAAMRRFGVQETGAVIGEGGEFETLVLDGPGGLFRKKVVVDDGDRRVVREGGGTAWLWLRNARVEPKDRDDDDAGEVRIPGLLDAQFQRILESLQTDTTTTTTIPSTLQHQQPPRLGHFHPTPLQHYSFLPPSTPSSLTTQTTSLLTQIQSHLLTHRLSPSHILTATILLRHISDFPALNALYAPLFSLAPNPPSRVTLACGALLPPDVHVAISLTVTTTPTILDRQALHVQSRSYWAPANIGPYSQAVSFPACGGARTVYIAGQIPLIPSSMLLPPPEDDALQVVLALQHLVRIALDTSMGVQWFAGAVAYFPRSGSGSARAMARLAGRAWKAIHARPAEEDEDDEGPDLWDRRFNPLYRTLDSSAGDGGKKAVGFPDWDVLQGSGEGEGDVVPPFFGVEVEELPRGAGVEWHGLVGLAGVREGGLRIVEAGEGVAAVVVEGGRGGEDDGEDDGGDGGRRKKTKVVVLFVSDMEGSKGWEGVDALAGETLKRLGGEGGTPGVVVRYLDVKKGGEGYGGEAGGLVLPAHSLWDAEGRGLVSVSVYQGVFGEM